MIQDRIGPNRAVIKVFGKEFRLAGLLHTAADGLKFFTKEDFMPPKADKLLFRLAPIMAMGMVFALVATIPFGDTVCLARVPRRHRRTSSAGPAGAALGACARPTRRTGSYPIDLDDRAARRRHPLRLRDGGAGDHRRRDRRLVERQQVQPDGRPPRREPDGLATR